MGCQDCAVQLESHLKRPLIKQSLAKHFTPLFSIDSCSHGQNKQTR